MGKLFTLDATTKATIQDALDDIITEFGKDCRLIYPPVWSVCVNCVADPIGKKSANRWRHGGPLPFPNGTICPICKGQGGYHAEEATEDIQLKVEWDPKKFWYPVPNINIRAPHSVCQTKSFIDTLPKITRADRMIIQLPIVGFTEVTMRLIGTPICPGNIIQDRYVIATWEQRG